MGQCPFCKGAVQEDTLRFGGTCPQCLIEIPGEEAATDPGAQALERQAAEEQATTGGRGPAVVVAALLLLGGVGGAAAWFLRPAEPEPVASNDDWAVVPIDAHEDVFTEEEAEAEAVAAKGGATSGGSATGGSTPAPATGGQIASGGGDASGSSPNRASMNPGGSLSEQVAGVDPTASAGPGMISGPSIRVGSRGAQETLTDPQAISDMVRRVVSRNGRQLEDCYNDRLKVDPELQGRWRVAFQITPSGKTSKIKISALNSTDGELEACLQGKVERWRFSPIAQAQGVSKDYNFQR